MKIQHVALVLLWSVCVCVCDISSMASVVANQTTEDPGQCSLSNCPPDKSCTRVYFSHSDSTCIFLTCSSNASCDDLIAELGRRAQTEGPSRRNRPDPLQPPSPPAPPASTSAPAAPLSPPGPDGEQRSAGNSTDSSTSRTSPDEDLNGQVMNGSSKGGDLGQSVMGSNHSRDQGQVQSSTQPNAHQGQTLNNTLQNGQQGQPPGPTPLTPAPAAPPVSVAFVEAKTISSVHEVHDGLQMNETDHKTTTTGTTASATTTTTTTATATVNTVTTTNATTTTANATTPSPVKPAVPTNSKPATNSSFTSTTVTPSTTSATTTTTTVTERVTSPRSTTQKRPPSTPPPAPSLSHAPPVLPTVSPSTPSPGQKAPTAPPKVPDVTSDQDKAIVETAGGKLASHLVNTSSLIAVLIFGLLFLVVTVILFLRHAYESYKRRGYTQMDYLINGMYSDSGL